MAALPDEKKVPLKGNLEGLPESGPKREEAESFIRLLNQFGCQTVEKYRNKYEKVGCECPKKHVFYKARDEAQFARSILELCPKCFGQRYHLSCLFRIHEDDLPSLLQKYQKTQKSPFPSEGLRELLLSSQRTDLSSAFGRLLAHPLFEPNIFSLLNHFFREIKYFMIEQTFLPDVYVFPLYLYNKLPFIFNHGDNSFEYFYLHKCQRKYDTGQDILIFQHVMISNSYITVVCEDNGTTRWFTANAQGKFESGYLASSFCTYDHLREELYFQYRIGMEEKYQLIVRDKEGKQLRFFPIKGFSTCHFHKGRVYCGLRDPEPLAFRQVCVYENGILVEEFELLFEDFFVYPEKDELIVLTLANRIEVYSLRGYFKYLLFSSPAKISSICLNFRTGEILAFFSNCLAVIPYRDLSIF